MKYTRYLALLLALLLAGCSAPVQNFVPETTTRATTEATTVPATEPTTVPTEPPTEPPQPEYYTISMAGDCTLGTDELLYGQSFTFVKVVGDQYDYPFRNVLPYFASDDLTLVNFEGTLTEHRTPREKKFRFRGPVEYAKILTAGDIEMVNLCNNHSMDYGEGGYESTLNALHTEGIAYVEDESTALYTTRTPA